MLFSLPRHAHAGAARGGIINDKGEDTSVRRFVRGDIVALPAGWVMWILNNDTQQRFSMLGGARTDHLPHPAKWEVRDLRFQGFEKG